jgi:hypothetical protein
MPSYRNGIQPARKPLRKPAPRPYHIPLSPQAIPTKADQNRSGRHQLQRNENPTIARPPRVLMLHLAIHRNPLGFFFSFLFRFGFNLSSFEEVSERSNWRFYFRNGEGSIVWGGEKVFLLLLSTTKQHRKRSCRSTLLSPLSALSNIEKGSSHTTKTNQGSHRYCQQTFSAPGGGCELVGCSISSIVSNICNLS